MRFPSVAFVASQTRQVARRFPLVGVCSLAAAVAGVLAVDHQDPVQGPLRFLVGASLGLPLFTAFTLFTEKRGWSGLSSWGLQGLGLAVLLVVFLAWPGWLEPVQVRRYLQLSLGFHLLAAFLPFAGHGELNGFWQYNRTLFIRFLFSALYAMVLFLGLTIAILAVDKLFGVDVDDDIYLKLWITTGFVFTTWFFLGGIPRDLGSLEADQTYPAGLRVFSQFILLPLVTLYLAILTLYLGKVIVGGTWPSGWIGYLVSSVSVLGILSLLLVFPIQERAENRWVQSYSRWFYIVLLPSVVMLLLAIYKRVDQYGITENRYFLVVLSLWLAGISITFIVARTKNIKVIPISLCLIALLSVAGPWSAYDVSLRSQTGRLAGLLRETGIRTGRTVVPSTGDISREDRREISAVVHYVIETHGADPIRDWFEDGLADVDTIGSAESQRYGSSWRTARKARAVTEKLGIQYVDRWQQDDNRWFLYSGRPSRGMLDISDYDLMFEVFGLQGTGSEQVSIGAQVLEVDYDKDSASLRILRKGDVLIGIPLAGAVDSTYTRSTAGEYPNRIEPLTVQAENDRMAVLVVVKSLRGTREEDGIEVTNFGGLFLVRFSGDGIPR